MNREPSILYEDNHLLILNKAAGLLVQGDRTGDATILDWGKAYLKKKYNKPGNVYLNAAHRLDRPVSGAIICGRTSKAMPRLTKLFKEKKVQKTYWALCLAAPQQETGSLHHYLEKNKEKNIVRAYKSVGNGRKESILTYTYLGLTAKKHHLLEVHPLTGRPHQIRVQLSAMGCPIIGDLKYGAPTPLSDASIGLHCRSMTFEHPVKKEMLEVVADLPNKDWWELEPLHP